MSKLDKLRQQRGQVQQEQSEDQQNSSYAASSVDRIHQPAFDVNTITPLPGSTLIKVDIDEIQAAPNEWNFFADQAEDQVMNLAVSLKSEGQFSPIIVREIQGENKWECLAGHTRIRAARYLRDEGYEEFQYLYAFAFPLGKCSDDEARNIIVFSNTEQRTKLSPIERQKAFWHHYCYERNSSRNQFAKQLIEKFKEKYGIKRSQVYNYISINEKLITGFKKLLEKGVITQQNAISLTRMDIKWQEWIFKNYSDRINKDTVPKIVGKTIDDIKVFFDGISPSQEINKYLEPDFFKKVPGGLLARVFVPEGAEKDFEELLNKFYANKGI